MLAGASRGFGSGGMQAAGGGGVASSVTNKVEVTVKIEGGTGLERESARQGTVEALRAIGVPL